jgi:hypothetical protein
MCEEKIHLFDKSRDFGFRWSGAESRRLSRELSALLDTGLFLAAVAFRRFRRRHTERSIYGCWSSSPLTWAGRIRIPMMPRLVHDPG